MSILIKSIDMPKDGGLLCVNIYSDGKVCINLDLECKRIATAVPVPKHGRLIDAGDVCYQLEKQATIDGQPRAIRRARRIVADAPTIIEAEEGEAAMREGGNHETTD